mmetsp:Transcript_14417/g.51885  ORF Transcript_14417/g.51885 Transcript_14417/m.51885 type:complete len:320 (+) Transcript_14417:228-1187(+)
MRRRDGLELAAPVVAHLVHEPPRRAFPFAEHERAKDGRRYQPVADLLEARLEPGLPLQLPVVRSAFDLRLTRRPEKRHDERRLGPPNLQILLRVRRGRVRGVVRREVQQPLAADHLRRRRRDRQHQVRDDQRLGRCVKKHGFDVRVRARAVHSQNLVIDLVRPRRRDVVRAAILRAFQDAAARRVDPEQRQREIDRYTPDPVGDPDPRVWIPAAKRGKIHLMLERVRRQDHVRHRTQRVDRAEELSRGRLRREHDERPVRGELHDRRANVHREDVERLLLLERPDDPVHDRSRHRATLAPAKVRLPYRRERVEERAVGV